MGKHVVLSILISIALIHRACAVEERPPVYDPCHKGLFVGGDETFQNTFTPGIPWPAIAELMHARWMPDQEARKDLYSVEDVQRALKAAKRIPLDESSTGGAEESEDYHASAPATPAQEDAYRQAALSYKKGFWKESVAQFDKIAVDTSSPYRAAAAYSAARATLDMGDYPAVPGRVHEILSSNQSTEFHLAAMHLIGTRADQLYDPSLITAHYAEIAYLLKAPVSLVCHDVTALAAYAGLPGGESPGYAADMNTYLGDAFPREYPSFQYGERRYALDALSATDPFFELVKALAAPTPFVQDANWLVDYRDPGSSASPRIEAELEDLQKDIADEKAITAAARQHWQTAGNIMWGYVLAQRTAEISDLPAVMDMLSALSDLPHTAAVDYAVFELRKHFMLHAARLLLMNEREDEAIAFLRDHSANTVYGEGFTTRQGDGSVLLNGGLRYLLEKFDLEGARKWASEVGGMMPLVEIDPNVRPLLANNFDELIDGEVPGDGRGVLHPHERFQIPMDVVDFLPAERLIQLSDHPNLEDADARALLGSGWLRIYLLKGPEAAIDLLPRLRTRFPELATDIDDILTASSRKTQDHLLTRLLLRSPGIGLRPSWAKARGNLSRNSQQPIFSIDDYNHDDGNWWCAIDHNEVRRELSDSFFAGPLRLERGFDSLWQDAAIPFSGDGWFEIPENRTRLAILGDKLVAWHPLLKEAALSQLSELEKIQCAPQLLGAKAVAWAKSSNWISRKLGSDDHLAETLALAVKATRYGCRRDGPLGIISRQAFVELHRLYPQSNWASETRYWFDEGETPNVDGTADTRPVTRKPAAHKPLWQQLKDRLRSVWHWLQSHT